MSSNIAGVGFGKRHQKRIKARVLADTMRELDVTAVALSEMLGASPGFVSQCIANDDAPAWTEVACLGLREMARDKEADRPVVLVVQAEGARIEAIRTVLNAMNVEFAEVGGQ